MSGLDYNPHQVTVTPSANSIGLNADGSPSDYSKELAPSAQPGAKSAAITNSSKFSRIGSDQTDGSAVAKVLEDEGKV